MVAGAGVAGSVDRDGGGEVVPVDGIGEAGRTGRYVEPYTELAAAIELVKASWLTV